MNWNLSKLYKGFDDEKFRTDLNGMGASYTALMGDVEALCGADSLVKLLEKLNAQMLTDTRVTLFVQLSLSTNAQNEDALKCMDTLMVAGIARAKLYSLMSKKLADADVDALCEKDAYIMKHKYFLTLLKRDASHTIQNPAVEDAVFKMQLTGGEAFAQLRDQLDAGLMIDFDGEKLPLSAIRGKAYSDDADVRRRAYEAEIAAYPAIETPMAACLNSIKGEAITLCAFKNYETVLDTALDVAHMDRETLDAMLTAMRESLPEWRRYFRAKARLLGYKGGLKFYDLFAPVGGAARKYTLDEAHDTLVDVMGRFTPKMANFIDTAFKDKWIDAYPHEGKVGGAFCAPAQPIMQSYVLSNFDGSLASVGTLAHELGHAYHNSCVQHLERVTADYPMPLAETASIFNETLLVNNMLAEADDAARVTLLDQQISDAAQVVVDILSRFIFESEVVERRANSALTPKEMCEIMLDAQKQTYGDGLDENCMHKYMWACKSHYYSTGVHFYNFPYAFGLLFGTGVYALYLKDKESFPAMYDKLLESTCLGDVRDVAASVGINVASVDFWRESLDVFKKRIDEFVALCPAE